MFEADDSIFPSKPKLMVENKKSSTVKFILSMLLFAAVFISLFSDNYVFIIEVILVLVIHELGHFLMMKIYGYKSLNSFVVPFFGTLKRGEIQKISQSHKAVVSLMGPIPGLILGSFLLVYYMGNPQNDLIIEFSLLFLAVNLINIAPVDPLDGGSFIQTMFFSQNENAKMYFTIISSFILIGVGYYFDFLVLTFFGFFMAFKVRGFQKSQKIHENLNEINFDYKKRYTDLSNREYWTIRRVFLDSNPKIKDIIPTEMELWENEKLLVDQIKQLLRTEVVQDLNSAKKILLTIIFGLCVFVPLSLIYVYWPEILIYILPDGI